jgi:peroxiredoxin
VLILIAYIVHLTLRGEILIDQIINISSGNPYGVAQFCKALSVENAIFTAKARRRKE